MSKRSAAVPASSKPRKSTPIPSAPESSARPKPPAASARQEQRHFHEAAEWIDVAREAVEELLWTAEDALRRSDERMMTRASLRRSAHKDAIEAIRALRWAKRAVDAAAGRASR